MRLTIIALLFLVACSVEEPPQEHPKQLTPEEQCFCGDIVYVLTLRNPRLNFSEYEYTVRNDCTFNTIKFKTTNLIESKRYCFDYKW